jgi:AcrR family transcriptional regulator
MTQQTRMSAEERKQAIIKAAKPLFAANGFNGTSMRQIARAAHVSEALLYRHFPGKEAMYKEILSYVGTLSSRTVKELKELETGTETLILIVFATFQMILFEVPGKKEQQEMHERFLFYSLLEDVSYAQMVFRNIFDGLYDIVAENFEAAEKSGDIVYIKGKKAHYFWFIHHLAMALNLCHLSGTPAFKYDASKEELAEDAVIFALRGIGMTNDAIEKYFQPNRLRLFFKGLFIA